MTRLGALLGAACLGGAALGCAAAMKEARPLSEIAAAQSSAPAAGGPALDAAAIDNLETQAVALFRTRAADEEGHARVRQAADLSLRAAAADPNRLDAVVLAVRARVWLADHETSPAGRETEAATAVEIAQSCGRPGSGAPPAPGATTGTGAPPGPVPPIGSAPPVCVFWLGAALGVQARERPSTGLSALPLIEAAFKDAAARQPDLDQGGPDRALALLYLRAPGWPTGPGDPDLGLEHARKAVALGPEYPPNLLALGEALVAAGDAAGAREHYQRALDRARASGAAGEPDAAEWIVEAERVLAGGK